MAGKPDFNTALEPPKVKILESEKSQERIKSIKKINSRQSILKKNIAD